VRYLFDGSLPLGHGILGIPVKVNGDFSGKPNVPVKANRTGGAQRRSLGGDLGCGGKGRPVDCTLGLRHGIKGVVAVRWFELGSEQRGLQRG